MFKFAFFIMSDGLNFSIDINETNTLTRYIGVKDMEETMNALSVLVKEEFDLIDLCDAYNEEMKSKIEAVSGIRTCRIRYIYETHLPVVSDKFGIISQDSMMDELRIVDMHGGVGIIVKDMEQAFDAAEILKELNVDRIELCGWFDELKTKAIIDHINNSIAIGSCGVMKWEL